MKSKKKRKQVLSTPKKWTRIVGVFSLFMGVAVIMYYVQSSYIKSNSYYECLLCEEGEHFNERSSETSYKYDSGHCMAHKHDFGILRLDGDYTPPRELPRGWQRRRKLHGPTVSSCSEYIQNPKLKVAISLMNEYPDFSNCFYKKATINPKHYEEKLLETISECINLYKDVFLKTVKEMPLSGVDRGMIHEKCQKYQMSREEIMYGCVMREERQLRENKVQHYNAIINNLGE